MVCVFKPIAFALLPSPGPYAENENILLAVEVPILDGIPCSVKFCDEKSYAILNAGSFSSTQSSVLATSCVMTASISC